MAKRGRGAELNALRQKKKDEKTGSTKQKSQSSVSSNKNGGGRTGGLTRQQVQQKVSRSAGYTSSGKAKQPSTTQQANPYATSRNIINKSNSSTTQNNARRSRINGSVARGRQQTPINRRQTAATAAEMRRQQEEERLSRTSTGRKMLEQRKTENKAKAQTAEEWKDVKKLSTAEKQEWFTKKAQDAQERSALKNNTKVDKGTDNLATSAFKAMGLGAKSAGSSLLGRLERGSLNDTYESAKFKFDAMREGKSESEAQSIGDSKAQKRQEQRLAGLRAITKAAQERTEQIQEQEEERDRHKINIGGETFSLRKMAVGAASFTGQRLTDTVAMGPYSLLGMGARVLEDETNSGKEKADRLKKRLADSGQFSQEELDREFDKIDRRTTANAYASAGIEMLSELIFSGVGLSKKYLPEGATGLLDRTIGKLFGNVERSAVGRVALGIGEETAEEWIANPLQAAVSNSLTGNRLQGLQEESIRRAYQGQAQSLKEAHATAADINSQAFLDRAKEVYKESGANEEEATRIAELARDYFNADLTGDSETAQQKLQQITDILAGGENDLRDKWTLRDALEVAGEMVLSVGAEATPGAISTAQTGGQYKANYGIEGVRKLAKVVENLDTDKTHQASAIVDDIDKGKDISNTQVAMLMEWSNAAAQKAQDREITRDQVVQRKMRDENLFVPIVDTEYNLAPATAERFETITERVADLAQDYMGVKMSDRDAYAIGDVVAAYQTGTISAEQMNEINMENPENRAVFERATGIDLDQYTVKDHKGNINVAASNTAMQEDLFAKAADNYMKSARLEQENWNDVARGQAYEGLTSNMDGMGGVGIQRVLESVDPRNRDDFMLAGSVARRVYEHARATNDDWNTVKRDFTQAFGADMNESMKYVFDMAKQAKAISENKYYGKQVSPKSSIGDTVVAEGKFTNESARELKGSEIGVLTSIASELGIDVIMSDDLERNENGRYMSGKRTIMLNAANTMGENLEAIFSHEVTHHLAAFAPEEYIKLSRFVMDRWYKANPDEYNAEINRIQKLYKDAKNQELSPEEALEELIADGSRDFWQDGELINSVTTEEPSLAKSIINAIKSFLGKLRNILASGNITDENIREGFFAEIGAYDEAYRLWLTAYNAARSDSADRAIDEWQDKVFEETRDSISETDSDYMDAVNRGDMETAQRMVDEAAAEAMPNTKLKGRWYHGTENEFTEFNFSQGGKNGHADGYGIYLTNDPEVASSYGTRMIEGYVNVERPASALDTTTLTNDELHRLIARTVNEEAERLLEEGYDNLGEAKFDTWISNYTDTRYAGDIDKAIDEVIDSITNINGNDYDIVLEIMTGMGIRDYDEASKFYDILTEETGIDGFETKWGDESEMADPSTPTIALAFRSNQIKDASPVTYDDDGNVIPLSERFNIENPDIRYSISEEAKQNLEDEGLTVLEGDSVARYSLTSLKEEKRTKVRKALQDTGRFTDEQIDKWIEDIWSIAAIVEDNREKLDYWADRSVSSKKSNSDYKYTFDFSTLCPKRTYYQGTLNAIYKVMPDAILYPEDLIHVRKLLKDAGYQSPCGFCYVESERKWLDQKVGEFLKQYKGDYIPKPTELTATDSKIKDEHPEVWNAWLKFRGKLGQGGPRLVDPRTDYRGEILRMSQATIDELNSIGGLRFQSYSDFEVYHMLDMMQAIRDAAARGLKVQMYTKIPMCAEIFGSTGIKINLSLVAKTNPDGTFVKDSNGNLVFDDEEGMPYAEAKRLRDMYPENVGTILVGHSEEHIIEAMKDDRIDFIIPFHQSGWSMKEFAELGLKGYKDISSTYSKSYEVDLKTGKKADDELYSGDYWEDKDGKWNAIKYLGICKERGVAPMFSDLLHDNGDGSWSLKEDGSTDGYWKLLIDGKMYDNDGNRAEQQPVKPEFNMEAANRLLDETIKTEGDADTLPVAPDVVKQFVKEFKQAHPKTEIVDAKYSIAVDLDDQYMDAVNSGNMDEAQRLVDEAAKKAGYGPTTYYHGTLNDRFTAFDKERSGANYRGLSLYGKGMYFTKDRDRAIKWGKKRGYREERVRAIGAYLNLQNPFDPNKNISKEMLDEYNRISNFPSKEEMNGGLMIEMLNGITGDAGYSTEFLKKYGYDGVADESGNQYVAFEPEQIKSADPVTYADDGSVIPLSERFNPESDDIRYSLPTQDSDGNILTDGQMEYFKNSQARDEQGRLVPVYHTTNKGGFTIFDPSYSDDKRSLFFASNWDVSQTYGNYANSRFYKKEINSIEDVRRFLDEYSPDRYFVTQEQFDQAGGWEASMLDFENVTKGEQSDFDDYLNNPEGLIAIIGVPDNSPDHDSYLDDWISADSPDEIANEIRNHMNFIDANYFGKERGYYACYLNLENPMIVDARGSYWDAIPFGNEDAVTITEEAQMIVRQIKVTHNDEESGLDLLFVVDEKYDGNWSRSRVSEWFETSEDVMEFLTGQWGLDVGYVEDVMSSVVDKNGTVNYWAEDYIGANGDYLDPYDYEQDTYSTRQLALIAESNGFDGVIIKNCLDHGGKSAFDGIDEASDIYIAFDSNQVKDINNENPSENPDIRYSIPPEDETMNYAQTNAETTDNLWYTDPVMHEGAIRYSMSKKDFINGTTDKWNPAWKTEGRVLKGKSVEKDIRNVIMGAMRNSDTSAKYRQKVVKDTMLVARKAFDYMKSDEHTKAAALLYDHAHSIIEDLEFFGNQDESEFQRYKELKEYLRTTKITVPEDKRSDIDYEAFRRNNFHKILLGDGGIAPDKVWGHLNELWPEAFSEDIKGDIPGIMLQIENALDIYKPYAEAYSSEQCEEFAGDIANSLWDIIYEGEEYKSLADKYDDKAKAMKLRHQEAMRKVKENYKEKLTKQALDAKRKEYRKLDEQKAKLTDKHEQELSKTKEKYERKLKTQQRKADFEIATLKQNREYNIKRLQAEKKRAVEEERRRSAYKVANNRREQRERQMHRTLYDRILKEYKDLTHRLLNPSKDKTKNIPEQLRQPLAQMLYCFDLEKKRSKKLEEMYMIPTRSQLNFRQLKDAMEQVVKEDPTAYEMSDIHKYLKDKMTDLADRVDGKSIDALDEADMQIVKDLLSGLNKAIKDGQQLEIDGENYQKQVQCDKVGEGAAEHQKIYGKAKTYDGARKIVDNILNMGELTPIYFFKGIPGMYDMYRQLRTGFDEYVRNENEIIDKIADILAPYYKTNRKGQRVQGSEIEDWRHAETAETFDLISGDQTITLTIAQRMALYCLAKRSHAQGHMYSENGGIVASEITAGSKITKAKESVKGKIVEQKPVVLTPADVDNIIASLTDDQVKIAEQLQDLMSKDMSVLGNKASMKLTGIEMYKEDNYFPIKVQGDSRPTDIDNIGIREKIRNPGFSNPLIENAQNPIIVDDIFTVVASHCNEMNQYASYAVPITSFMKVYNGSVLDENNKPVKIKTLIRQTYGDKAITYIENFIDDINGNSFKRQGGLDDVLDKALGQAKKAAVFANLRVALQQPTAIVRAFAALDPKYFKGVKPSPKATQEMIEHCPIAQWKAWGYYDTHFGRDIEDVMMGKNVPNKMDYFMSEIYGTLDNMTWGMIWQAVKNEVKTTNKGIDENSQEFWDLCNERASYVFDTTQVVDSPFHRSNDMRSKNGLVKQLTSFQAEPTLSFNVLRQGLVDAIEASKTGNNSKARKVILRTLTVWTIQALTVALAQSFVDALRRKGKKDEDDDKDEMLTWYQEIAKYFRRNFGNNLADDMNPINNVYFFKDIVPPILNAIKGEYVFGQQNLTFQWVDSLTTGIEHCRMKWEKGDAYSKSWYDCISELLGGIGYFAGVPAKTMLRGVKNAFHWFNKVTGANVFADDGSVVDSTVESVVSRFRGSGESSGSESSGTKTGSSEGGTGEPNTTREERDKAIRKEADQIKGSVADKTGEEREKATWKKVTDFIKENEGKSVEELVASGDYDILNKYRVMYVYAGNTKDYFDQRIFDESKSAMKKSILYDPTEQQTMAQQNIKDYLTANGMSEADLSEIAYKSETKKDLAVACRIGDEDAMVESLVPLIRAGLTYEDFVKIYDNRNRVDLKKYKDKGGRYASKLKSMGTFIWPTKGVVTSHFGYRDAPTAGASSNHPAIDIGASQGTPVVAADGGVVIYAGNNGGYGNSVGIKHDNGMVTYYNHLYAWNVKVGDSVGQGQQIAQVGSTGISTGPHLDFKILDKNGKPVDPEKYLN